MHIESFAKLGKLRISRPQLSPDPANLVLGTKTYPLTGGSNVFIDILYYFYSKKRLNKWDLFSTLHLLASEIFWFLKTNQQLSSSTFGSLISR